MTIFLCVLKHFCLALGIVYTFSNVGKIIKAKNPINDAQLWLMAIGIVGYIAL